MRLLTKRKRRSRTIGCRRAVGRADLKAKVVRRGPVGSALPAGRIDAMDYSSLILTTFLVITLIAILGWIDDWSGSRRHAESSRYWNSHKINCPGCARIFTPSDIESAGQVITHSKHFDIKLTCPSCDESFEYARTEGEPKLLWQSPTTRRCVDCNIIYTGIAEQECPACGSIRSHRGAAPIQPGCHEPPASRGKV